jgi:hypothetical protein
MVGQPLDLSKLRLQFYLYSLRRASNQQDWYKVVRD